VLVGRSVLSFIYVIRGTRVRLTTPAYQIREELGAYPGVVSAPVRVRTIHNRIVEAETMDSIIYLVGLIVIVMFILSALGLH
jgi:hypothetical protein